jgi:hypothetical protein
MIFRRRRTRIEVEQTTLIYAHKPSAVESSETLNRGCGIDMEQRSRRSDEPAACELDAPSEPEIL